MLVSFGRSEALLRKEKDEASLSNCLLAGFVTNAFILRFLWGLKVFYFVAGPGFGMVTDLVIPDSSGHAFSPALVSQPKPVPAMISSREH